MDLSRRPDGLFPKSRWTFSDLPKVLVFYRQSPDGPKVHPGWTQSPSGMELKSILDGLCVHRGWTFCFMRFPCKITIFYEVSKGVGAKSIGSPGKVHRVSGKSPSGIWEKSIGHFGEVLGAFWRSPGTSGQSSMDFPKGPMDFHFMRVRGWNLT